MKWILKMLGLGLCLPAVGLAAGISLVGADDAGPRWERVVLPPSMERRVVVETVDPNFADLGRRRFSGFPLPVLSGLAGFSPDQDMTLVGTDQYVSFLPSAQMARACGILADRADGAPISPHRGGPLKMIYPERAGLHLAAYTWYVDTIFLGDGRFLPLRLTTGDGSRLLSAAKMAAMTGPEVTGFVSIPNGYRKDLPPLPPKVRHAGVPLSRFLAGREGSWTQIEFIPHVGRPVVVDRKTPRVAEFLVVTRLSGKPLHPAFGGPYSLMLPEDGMADGWLSVDALFFLKEIRIHGGGGA